MVLFWSVFLPSCFWSKDVQTDHNSPYIESWTKRFFFSFQFQLVWQPKIYHLNSIIRIKLEAFFCCHLTDITQNLRARRIYGRAKIKLDLKTSFICTVTNQYSSQTHICIHLSNGKRKSADSSQFKKTEKKTTETPAFTRYTKHQM